MESARQLLQRLPLSRRQKQKIKHCLFRNFPYIFRRFQAYSNWLVLNPPIPSSLFHADPSAWSDSVESGKFPAQRILVVSQDAQAYGSQFLALGMVKALKQDLGFDVKVVLLGGGRLKSDFSALATVYELNEFDSKISDVRKLAKLFVQHGFNKAIVNTTVSGWVIPAFRDAGIESLSLVHELPGVIRDLELEKQARQIALSAKIVVFPAKIVADGFAQFAQIESARQVIRPQGLYRRNKWRSDKEHARAELRGRLGLALATEIVLAVGYATYRKGVDLFVESALKTLSQRSDVDFIWIGNWDAEMQDELEQKVFHSPYKHKIHFVGYEPDTALYHAASDVYALTSREDPFPSVVLESFDAGVPVVAFSTSGGGASLVEEVGGITVPAEDVAAFSTAICRLIDSPEYSASLGKAAQEYVDRNLDFSTYLRELCSMLGFKVSSNNL